MPLVSFIIPVYNSESYLCQCLDSVLAQTEQDIEILVVDDGSTDGGPALIDRYAASDPRISVFHKSNAGPSSARNYGLDRARGKWVSFLDADDYLLPEFLQHLLNDAADAELCIGTKQRLYQNKRLLRRNHCRDFSGTKEQLKPQLNHYLRELRGATGRIYLTDVIQSNALRFDETIRYAEDMKFNYLFVEHCHCITFTDRGDYVYRIHNPHSLSKQDHTFFLKQWRMQNQCIRKAFHKRY